MFLKRHMQDGSANGYLLHSEFLTCFRARKSDELSAYFAPAGMMRVIDARTGGVLEEANGRDGVRSLARSIHENVEFTGFETHRLRWIAGGVLYGWTATVRNWGFGPARAASGKVRLEFSGGSIRCADFRLDPDLWFELIRPRA
ncbi:MAG: hypothetical protein ACK4MV_19630 [Beijerinckiaceae bacterium]